MATAGIVGDYEVTPPLADYAATHVVETVARGAAAFTVRATHGAEFSPPLPVYGASATTASTSKSDVLPNGLSWSSPDEPEHVPPKFSALVGARKKAILGMATTRDSLFLLKEDGVYRVTGTNGDFRVERSI